MSRLAKIVAVVAVAVLGLLGTPAMPASICNGGTDCPDVLVTPISATGSFNDLSDPDNIKIAVGNSFLVELNLDGRTFPAVDVVAADMRLDISGGGGLNCVDFDVDTGRSDIILSTCSQCAGGCGPPNAVGLIDFSGGSLTVDFLGYIAEMTLTCKVAGSFTLGPAGSSAGNTIASLAPGSGIINIVDDPTHFESINVVCVDTCNTNADCEDNDVCTNNVCNLGTGACSFPKSAAAVACETESDLLCGTFECNTATGDCDNLDPVCDDNNACTDNICAAGQCSYPQSAAAAACAAQTNAPCATFECNTITGGCNDLSSINNGAACTDNNSCTDGDACLGGICDPGELILGRVCGFDSHCDNVEEGIPADPGTCVGVVLLECTCPVATPTPTVVGGIGSRYIQIAPDLSGIDAVALRVECNGVIEWVELTPALTDYDDGPQGLVNVGVGRSTCDGSYFLTPDAWTSSGTNPLYVTGLSVAPESRPMVYAVSGDCTTPRDSDPGQSTSPTWVFGDSDGDGQVTFSADLFRQFTNLAATGGPFFTGPNPGVEVDTQGNSPTVPDQRVSGFFDVFKCFLATTAGGGETWTGQVCP